MSIKYWRGILSEYSLSKMQSRIVLTIFLIYWYLPMSVPRTLLVPQIRISTGDGFTLSHVTILQEEERGGGRGACVWCDKFTTAETNFNV